MKIPKVKLVTSGAAAKRALCLRSIIKRGEFEVMFLQSQKNGPDQPAASPESLKQQSRDLNYWLKDEELWEALAESEKSLLKMPVGTWSGQQMMDATWRTEALAMIGWAIRLTDTIIPYDQQQGEGSFILQMELFKPVKDFVARAQLRPAAEISKAREVAELWHWRARTTTLQKQPGKYSLPAGYTYEKIIEETVRKAGCEKLFTPIDGDFPARGRAYRQLSDSEWSGLCSIARERQHALNWLCGRSENWDWVRTDT